MSGNIWRIVCELRPAIHGDEIREMQAEFAMLKEQAEKNDEKLGWPEFMILMWESYKRDQKRGDAE